MADKMQNIQRRIKSIGSTERITNAMKLVSAAKLRKARNVFESTRRYMGTLLASMQRILDDTPDVPDEFLVGSREIKKKCYLLITSSNGLCGSFNGNVIRAMEEELARTGSSVGETKLITVGTKGKEYFAARGAEILIEHDAPADTVTFEETKDVSGPLMEMYLKGEIDEIDIVFTSYINPLRQEVVVRKLLPLNIAQPEEGNYVRPIEFEPSPVEVFTYLIPKYIELMIFSACIESAACEYAARRTAMENANDNARDMLADLELQFNHARQSAITDEIIEIVAGSQMQS